MAGLGDIVQKAFYLGVGLASYAAEKAGSNLQGLRAQAQKLADEMVERGEMTSEEARRYVDELVRQAQTTVETTADSEQTPQDKEPRRIEIVTDEEEPAKAAATEDVDALRHQVESLQAELRRLKRE